MIEGKNEVTDIGIYWHVNVWIISGEILPPILEWIYNQ